MYCTVQLWKGAKSVVMCEILLEVKSSLGQGPIIRRE